MVYSQPRRIAGRHRWLAARVDAAAYLLSLYGYRPFTGGCRWEAGRAAEPASLHWAA